MRKPFRMWLVCAGMALCPFLREAKAAEQGSRPQAAECVGLEALRHELPDCAPIAGIDRWALQPPGRHEHHAAANPVEWLLFEGRVASSSEDWLSIRDHHHNLFRLRVTAGTEVHRKNEPLQAEHLAPGTPVRATASFGEGEPVVRKVEVLQTHHSKPKEQHAPGTR